MTEERTTNIAQNPTEAVIRKLEAVVRDGIRHGHFAYTIRGGDGSGGYTEVVIEAGKSYRYLVPKR